MLPPTKKKKMNPLFMKVIVISVAAHVIAGFIATIITVANIVIKDDAQFDEPPAVVEETPPPEVKIQIKPAYFRPAHSRTRNRRIRPNNDQRFQSGS